MKMKMNRMYDIYEDLMQLDKNSIADRAKGAAMIMQRYGDKEMSDALNMLSGQLDFYDSDDGNDAIKRTNDKLDKLIKEHENRHAMSYMSLLTDEDVLAMSNGEVTEFSMSDLESCFLQHGLFDPDIFGGSGKIPYFDDEKTRYYLDQYGTGVGHIVLPCYVVPETNYRIIAHLLGQTYDSIRKLAKYENVVVTNSGKSDVKPGTIMSEKEFADYHDPDMTYAIGGDAIYDMLKALNYSDQPERLAYRVLPVVSPVTRPIAYSQKESIYCVDPMTSAYEEILRQSNRLHRLLSLGVPAVIMYNEKRILGEAVNRLCQMAVKHYAKRIHKTNAYVCHNFYQCMLICRYNMISAVCIPSEKLSDIESLGIYPKTIRVKTGDTYADVALCQISKDCEDAIFEYDKDSAVVISKGVDPDHLPEDLQAKMDEVEAEHTRMEEILNSILDGAKIYRESFVVEKDKSGMYVPYVMTK